MQPERDFSIYNFQDLTIVYRHMGFPLPVRWHIFFEQVSCVRAAEMWLILGYIERTFVVIGPGHPYTIVTNP